MTNGQEIKSMENMSSDEFEAFVGKSAHKFIQTRYKLQTGRRSDFGWLPFIFPLFWSAYYKFWKGIILGFLVSIAALAIPLFLIETPENAADIPTEDVAIFYSLLLSVILLSIFCGYFLKPMYVKYVENKIGKFKSYESDKPRLYKLLNEVGGTSKSWLIASILLFLALNAFSVVVEEDIKKDIKVSYEQTEINQEDESSESTETDDVSQNVEEAPTFTEDEREKFISGHESLEMFRQIGKACLVDSAIAQYVDIQGIEAALEKIDEMAELSSNFHEKCFNLSKQSLSSMREEGAKRFADSENGHMLQMMSMTSTVDEGFLENHINGCNQFIAGVNQAYFIGVKQRKIFSTSCPE